MLSPKNAIGAIYSVTKLIYDQVQQVKTNKAQCLRLQQRIKTIEEAIGPLTILPDDQKIQFQGGLNELVNTLNRALELITKFSVKRNWFVDVAKAGTHKEQFEGITKALAEAIPQLSLCIVAQEIINHGQDKQDQEKDQQLLISQLDEILKLNMQSIEELQGVRKEQREGHEIIVQQMESLRGKISLLINANESKRAKPPISRKYTVAFCDLLFDEKIGEGSLGKIYRGRRLEQEVAIKLIDDLTPEKRAEFIRAVKIQSQLRSPRIVPFYAACLEPNRACLVMEYCSQQSLREVLDSKKLILEQKKQLIHDIACGLYYLHENKVIHRDLQSANILVDQQGRAKLDGFSLAKINDSNIQTARNRSQAYEWLAPEIFKGQEHTVKSDVYSFGVIVWEILTGQRPFVGKKSDEIIVAVLQGKRESLPSEVPEEFANLIQQCWHEKPEERPDALMLIRIIDKIVVHSLSPSAEECYLQGQALEMQKQYLEAFKKYQLSQQKGYYKANTAVATFFATGLGSVTSINKEKAFEHFFSAAKAGHERAMYNVAIMFEKGEGTLRDLEKALYWYEQFLAVYKKINQPANAIKDAIKEVEGRMTAICYQLREPEYQLNSFPRPECNN